MCVVCMNVQDDWKWDIDDKRSWIIKVGSNYLLKRSYWKSLILPGLFGWKGKYSKEGLLEVNQVNYFYFKFITRRFGRKETYADLLAMCSHCCSIYWQVKMKKKMSVDLLRWYDSAFISLVKLSWKIHHGLRQLELTLCCLWMIMFQSLGHPCVGESNKSEKVLTPEDFIRLFPL